MKLPGWQRVEAGFLSLKGSPRGLWTLFGLKVLESFNYFSLSIVLTLYLTEEYGVSDVHAGELYGIWGVLTTLYGFLFGWVIDWLGVKHSFAICGALGICGRLLMSLARSRTLLLWALFLPTTLAGALGVPVLLVGVKHLTTQENRGFAFALVYSLMNVAALAAGMLRDLFCVKLAHGLRLTNQGERALLNNGSRLFMLLGSICAALQLLVTLVMLPQIWPASKVLGAGSREASDDTSPLALQLSHVTTSEQEEQELANGSAALDAAEAKLSARTGQTGQAYAGLQFVIREKTNAVWRDVKAVVGVANFWRYLSLAAITVNLKAIFRHLDATLPKYQIRKFGCNALVGLIYSINPFMIVLLVPLVGALTTSYSHFNMIHYGGYVSALSPFWIVLFQSGFASVLFVAQLSLGEMIWSPRWYDLSMSVAPDGKEGLFTAIASAPLFIATWPTGALSGWLLQQYCPDLHVCGSERTHSQADQAQACQGRQLWLVVGLVTLSSPVLILIFQRWLRPQLPQMHGKSEANYHNLSALDDDARSDSEPNSVPILPPSIANVSLDGMPLVVAAQSAHATGQIINSNDKQDP